MTESQRSPGPHSCTKRIAFRLGAVLVGVLIAFVVAEIALRVLGVSPPAVRTKRYLVGQSQHFHCYPSNPNGEFRRVPDVSTGNWKLFDTMLPAAPLPLEALSETPWCVEYRRSPQGIRDRIYPRTPDPKRLRIAGMGDSFAGGEGVALEKSLFKQMEQQYGPAIEIINAAQVGIALAREAAILEELVPAMQCKRAIVVVIANDIGQSSKLQQQQDYINDLINVRDDYLAAHEERMWYSGPSRVFQVIGSHIERRRLTESTIRWYRDLYDEAKNGKHLEEMGRDFERIARLPHCESVVVIYPLMENVGDAYPLCGVHDTIARLAKAAGLPTLDLVPAFHGRHTEALQVHPSDHHPNGAAHAIAARAILAWLEREHPRFLPQRR